MTVWAKDLKVVDSAMTAFVAWVDVVNVEESVFGGIGSAVLAGPAYVSEGEFEYSVKVVDALDPATAQLSVVAGKA